ncbi:MAG TPA: LytTR family DNA-binding domain-containing protein [Kofleriaceae bacterium]|nr:LytTR family DNA-binding domain-containing protein [Kofleriaceae bacterium]
MTILVLEDELPARTWLTQVLARHRPNAAVTALASVADALAWLAAHPPPDLILADIQLADGLSLEIFERAQPGCPVIFTTAYDEYLVEAMQRDGIAYLLKPLREEDVAGALAKYDRLESHFTERMRGLLDAWLGARAAPLAQTREGATAPRRLVARRRDGFVVLSLAEIAYFVVVDKLVEVVTRDGRRFAVDQTLGELERDLADEVFRVNRQYLVHASAVAGFRPFVKGKLLVELAPAAAEEVIVSQENAARFRAWLAG